MRNSILRPLGIAAITATLALGACGGQNTGDAGSSSADSTSDKQAKAESTLPQGRLEAPGDARVYFIGLEDGDTVSSPVTLRFGLLRRSELHRRPELLCRRELRRRLRLRPRRLGSLPETSPTTRRSPTTTRRGAWCRPARW